MTEVFKVKYKSTEVIFVTDHPCTDVMDKN